MFARIATFEGGNVAELRRLGEERMASGDTGMPDGVSRAMVLEGDRRLFVTFFETREAMQAAEQRFEAMGDEIPEDVRGQRLSVDTYEVVMDESV
ncbi:MAG TPA: hypothetical protein VH305_08825 [Gaiella sp.]